MISVWTWWKNTTGINMLSLEKRQRISALGSFEASSGAVLFGQKLHLQGLGLVPVGISLIMTAPGRLAGQNA